MGGDSKGIKNKKQNTFKKFYDRKIKGYERK